MPKDEVPLILVVEDNFLTRMSAVDWLRDAGFAVIGLSNADEAVAVLSERDDVAAVFTDIEMPGSIDGVDLAAIVHERWPWMGIVVTSGRRYVVDEDIPAGASFVPKPYEPSDLVETFRGVGIDLGEMRPH